MVKINATNKYQSDAEKEAKGNYKTKKMQIHQDSGGGGECANSNISINEPSFPTAATYSCPQLNNKSLNSIRNDSSFEDPNRSKDEKCYRTLYLIRQCFGFDKFLLYLLLIFVTLS